MKRFIDVLLVIMVSPITLPIFLLIGGIVRAKLGSPVIFIQERPGRNAIPFQMVKFRTMSDKRGDDGQLLPDAQRLDSFGKLLRASSLDELPELWNVLIGDMSLVGPRPLLVEYLPLYTEKQSQRHNVRPGMTGWAQVNGRNAISWEEKFDLDVWYVENQSFLLDMKILFMTIRKVLTGDGVSADEHVTTEKFRGDIS